MPEDGFRRWRWRRAWASLALTMALLAAAGALAGAAGALTGAGGALAGAGGALAAQDGAQSWAEVSARTVASHTVFLPAVFHQYPPCFGLTLGVEPAGSGTVEAEPPPGCGDGLYVAGTEVMVTAIAQPGWAFAGWSGDLAGTDNPASLVMDADRAVTATFVLEEYVLTVEASGQGTVAVDPEQATYHYGAVVSLTATADPGWAFLGWSGDLLGSENPGYLTMTGDKWVTATFGSGVVGPVLYAGHAIDDDQEGASQGDGDGVADCGETIELYVDLLNQGDLVALDVVAAAGSEDVYVTWSGNGLSGYPDIPAGGVARNDEAFGLELDASTPDGHSVPVTLAITATNAAPWTDSFSIPVTCTQEPLPERTWDPRLDEMGVYLEPAAVDPGQPHWYLVEALWADPIQSAGRHHIFFDVLDANEQRVMGQPVVVEWPGGSWIHPIEKFPPDWGTNFAMYATLGSYDAWVGGGQPSDRVVGMGLGTPAEPDIKHHTSFYLTFQWVGQGGDSELELGTWILDYPLDPALDWRRGGREW